jgi:hypothetical protein
LKTRILALSLSSIAILALGATPALGAPQLIKGTVSNPPGVFAAALPTGDATVFLDESATSERGSFRSVGYASVRAGAFRLTTSPTPLLRRAAARNGGWVNLLLLVRTPTGKAVLPFTRKLVDGRWSGGGSPSPRLVLHPWTPGTAGVFAEAAQHERADCDWKRSHNYRRYTRVGQLHQWDGFRSVFHYASGSRAESTIGAAIAYGDGPFEARGTSTVTKTNVGERGSIIRPNAGRFSRYIQTRFAYYYYYLVGRDCNRGPDDLTKVLRTSHHVGGSYYKDHDDAAPVLDGHCHTARGKHRLIVAPKSTEWVVSGEAKRVDRGIKIFGVTLGSQSGWSTHVRSEWTNVGTVSRAICSVYGEPNTAPVTYVGGIVRD